MKRLLFGIVILILVCGCTTNIHYNPITERVNISSLDREMLVYGHFSLGSGVVESIPSYFYYVKLLNGGYKLKHIPTDICTIFRDENESPYIIAHYYNGIPSSGGIYGNVGDRNIIRIGNTYIDEETGYVHTEYVWYDRNGDVEIHIPSNSTIEEFIP